MLVEWSDGKYNRAYLVRLEPLRKQKNSSAQAELKGKKVLDSTSFGASLFQISLMSYSVLVVYRRVGLALIRLTGYFSIPNL